MTARAKHSNWLVPPSSSYDPYGRSYVGGAAEDARDVVRQIDSVAVLFPVTTDALLLQKWILDVADELGLRSEVEYMVYALRAASSAAGFAAAPASASMASTGALAGGLVVAVVVVVVFLFLSGSDEDEARQKTRQKDAQKAILRLRDRLSLTEFAAEQRSSALTARAQASVAKFSGSSATELTKRAAVADKLAILYDRAAKELPAGQRQAFESISNLARWRAALTDYAAMIPQSRDSFDSVGFGTSAPRLPSQLKPKIAAEEQKVRALAASGGKVSAASGPLGTAVLIAGGGAILYFFAPGLALGALGALWSGTKRASSYVAGKAKGAVT